MSGASEYGHDGMPSDPNREMRRAGLREKAGLTGLPDPLPDWVPGLLAEDAEAAFERDRVAAFKEQLRRIPDVQTSD